MVADSPQSATAVHAPAKMGERGTTKEVEVPPKHEADVEGAHQEDEEEPVVTLKTWTVVCILATGYGLSFWPIPVMASIGGFIGNEFGELDKYVWFIPARTISITICFLLCGANTDLLGRRWFLVIGNFVCVVGHLVTASSKNANSVIAGMAIAGFGGGNCQMAAFALSELLPNKWRHIGVVIADSTTLMAVILAPVAARYGYETGGWKWNFWAAAIAQFASFLGLLFLYYLQHIRQYGIPIKQMVKEVDYVGGILFVAGALPVLMGIVWTTTYPSNDPHVIAPLIIGFFFIVCFALWERFSDTKHPLTPTYVFTASHGRDLTAPLIALGVVNMFYYSSSILWPTMINVFYTNGGTDWKYGIVLSVIQGLAITLGALLLSAFGSKIRNWQWQLTGSVFVMVVFGGMLALATPEKKGMMIAYVFMSQTGYGYAIYLAIAVSQMGVDHKDLGLSGGIAGVSRFAAGSIAAAIHTTVLTNVTNEWTKKLVHTAAIAAGLPRSGVDKLMTLIGTPALAATYSKSIVAAVGGAVEQAYVHRIKVTAYTSLGFGIVGFLACLCCKDVDAKMNNKIEVYLENAELADRNKYH